MLVCLWIRLCAYVRAETPSFDEECATGPIASPPEGPVKRVSVQSVLSPLFYERMGTISSLKVVFISYGVKLRQAVCLWSLPADYGGTQQ